METKEFYNAQFNETLNALTNLLNANENHIRDRYTVGLCPYLQFITVDFLKREDWPNNIAQNSRYVTFSIDYAAKTIELHRCGNVYLSDADSKATFLAMTSLKHIMKAKGDKFFRKSKFKDINDLAAKMAKFTCSALDAYKWYSGGYPFHKGIRDIYVGHKVTTYPYPF